MSYCDTRLVGVNDRGNRVGEDHPRAKLSNADVDLIWELLEPTDGAKPMSLRAVAEKFEVSKSCIQWIRNGGRRAVYATGWRRIPCTARFVEPVRAAARLNSLL